MAGLDKKLTDLTELASPTDNAWIHVVEPTDISQSPEGSSFKVKKSNFGGLSDAPSDGETYGRKDGAWEIVGGGDVLTTNTNITSLSLTTQDVSGFVAYINGLVSSFAVAANEIRTYTVTDTGQKFEILLRGRSFGGSEPDILTSDVLEIEKGSDNFHTVVFSGFMSVPDFTNWYAQTRNGQNILNPTYTAYGTITPSNSFSDDLNILPNNIIPFKHKVHSCFGHFYSNISGSIPVDFAVRTFVFPNGANMGIASAALNSTIVARRVITQTAGGSQPNVEFTGSEINSAYVGEKNSWCKLYFKNNFGATIGQFGFNITIVFQKVD